MLFLILSAVAVTAAEDFDLLDQTYYDTNEVNLIFEQFMARHNKFYEDEEYDERLEIFKKNLEEINMLNYDSDGAVFSVNEYSDMTAEEFFKCFTGVNGNMTSETMDEVDTSIAAPTELDYRKQGYVTAVKNQQHCGSCYAFSAIGNIEGQYAMKHKQLLTLSEQQALDCDRADGGCHGGQVHNVFQALMREGGSMQQKDYPYEAVQRQCRTNRNKIAVKLTGGGRLGVHTESALKNALASHGPLSVYMYTSPEMRHLRNGIFKPRQCNTDLHAVTLIGYGKEGSDDYWLIKNSWGQGWGDRGFFRLVMGRQACGIGSIYTACAKVA